jgi:feruloyl-CoA synthase
MTAGRRLPALQKLLRNLREIAPTVYFNVPKGFEMLAPHLRDDAALRRSFIRDFARTSLPAPRWRNTPGMSLDAAVDPRARSPHADAVRPRRDGNRSLP